MVQHEKIAKRILKILQIRRRASPVIRIRTDNCVLQFRWDAVGETEEGKLVLLEVEPANSSEDHIASHLVNFLLVSHFKLNVKKLIWIVYADWPNCHETLSLQIRTWKTFLSKIIVPNFPPMEIRNRSGKLLEQFL